MAEYKLFELTDEIVDKIKSTSEIPVDFHNKDGQVLIHKKVGATEHEIEKLLNFVKQGIYYNLNDSDKLGVKKQKDKDIPEGLTNTKLLNLQLTEDLMNETTTLFDDLEETTFNSLHAEKSAVRINAVFKDFESQEDMMTGLVNVMDMMKSNSSGYEVQLAIKRTIIAMAIKTRGIKTQTSVDRTKGNKVVEPLMMSALFSHLGQIKMKMPTHAGLNEQEIMYIRKYPLMSYLMIAHEPTIDHIIKRNILNHRRSMVDNINSNNYPKYKWMLQSLETLLTKNAQLGKKVLVSDLAMQIKFLRENHNYDEDANILSLASEFASLTSKVAWRDAFEPTKAVKMLINNSYFTYSNKILREFLDHAAISLCDNSMVLNEKDLIIMAITSHTGEDQFEIGIIREIDRYQSRPKILRFGNIQMIKNTNSPVLKTQWDISSVKLEKRIVKLTLGQDFTRNIIYFIDPEMDPQLYEAVAQIAPSI